MKKMLIINLQLFAEGEGTPTEGFSESDFEAGFDEGFEGDEGDLGEDTTPLDEPLNEGEEVVETQAPEVEEQQEPQKIKIRYNKQDMELTLDEVTTLAQKGMNYDKQLERLQSFENNPGLLYLNELAQRNNTSVENLVNYWREMEYQEQIDQLVQNNIPEEYAKEMVESKKFRDQMQRQQEEQTKQAQYQEQQRNEVKDFIEAFGQVPREEIPDEVWEKVDSGVPLKYAYMEYNNSKLQQENKILKQNKTNRDKAPISKTSTNGSKDNFEKDDFLDGFMNY